MKRRQQTIWIVGILVVLVCLSGLAYVWVAAASRCAPQESQDTYAKTIAALDGIVDLGLKLSTSLVGLGAAVLIGWKAGLNLTFPIKVIILAATLLLIQSALYAVWQGARPSFTGNGRAS